MIKGRYVKIMIFINIEYVTIKAIKTYYRRMMFELRYARTPLRRVEEKQAEL